MQYWKHAAWSVTLAVTAVGCQEDLNAPGACPEFCPPSSLTTRDTVLLTGIRLDSAFLGFQDLLSGPQIQITTPDNGIVSRGLLRFVPFADSVPLVPGALFRPVVATDSFRLDIPLLARSLGATGVEVVVHRLPIALADSAVSFDDVTPFFDDSTLIGSVAIPDGETPDTIRAFFAADAFSPPADEDADFVAAVGLEVRANGAAFVSFPSVDTPGLGGATMVRFVQLDSASGQIALRAELRGPTFDTFVTPPQTLPGPDTLVIGGGPLTAQSLFRTAIPSFIIDSSSIVSAILTLTPTEPLQGGPGDDFLIQPVAVGADLGAKSPLLLNPLRPDSSSATVVTVGSTAPVRIDLGLVIGLWQNRPELPRTFMLRVTPTGGTLGRALFASSRMSAVPSLELVFVPPFSFSGQ